MRYAAFLLIAFLLPVTAFAALVNINTADASLLDTLPGIGPAKAQAIIGYRIEHGLFKTIEDIQNVSGIGPVTYANLKDKITVGVEAPVQLVAPTASSKKVQEVDPITSQTAIEHEEGIRAPATTSEHVVAGAAFPADVSASRGAGIFHSFWTLGLVGVVLLAGGAFIFI